MSNLRLIHTLKVWVFIQDQVVTIVSAPSLRNRQRGIILVRNAHFTAVLTLLRAQSGAGGWGKKEVRIGYVSSKKIVTRLVTIIVEV